MITDAAIRKLEPSNKPYVVSLGDGLSSIVKPNGFNEAQSAQIIT